MPPAVEEQSLSHWTAREVPPCWFYFYFLFIYFVAALGLHCCARASHCDGFSCCGARALGAQASVVVARGLSCSAACGIFPDQGSTPCPLFWQEDLNHWTAREVPPCWFYIKAVMVGISKLSRDAFWTACYLGAGVDNGELATTHR